MVDPGPGETPDEPPRPEEHDETVVDPAVLAERRARRAEQAEEAHARRAAEADEALATAQAELHRAQVRLERVLEDRARLDAQLAARDRELRAARERAHAEERQRQEEVAQAADRLDRLGSEAASLRRRVESAGEADVAALRERGRRAEAAAARLRADLEAQIAAEASVREALESARAQLADLRRLAGSEVGEEVARRVAELRALADALRAKLTVLEAERRTALATARRSDEARAALEAERDALRGEAERSASALLATRAAPAVDPGLRAALDVARGELAEARQREHRTQGLARELVATASSALAEAEARLAEAETVTRGLRDDLDVERGRRQGADEALAAVRERADEALAAVREEGDEALAAVREEADKAFAALREEVSEARRARDESVREAAGARDGAVREVQGVREEAVREQERARKEAGRERKEAARDMERAHRETLRTAERGRAEADRGRKDAVREAERSREDSARARVVAAAAERTAEEAGTEAKRARKRAAESERSREALASRVAELERIERPTTDVRAQVSELLELERRELRRTEDRLIAEIGERSERLAEAESALARAAPRHDEATSTRLAAEIRLAQRRRPDRAAIAEEARFAAAVLPRLLREVEGSPPPTVSAATPPPTAVSAPTPPRTPVSAPTPPRTPVSAPMPPRTPVSAPTPASRAVADRTPAPFRATPGQAPSRAPDEAFASPPVAAALPPAVVPGPGWLRRAAVEIAGRDPLGAEALLRALLPLHGLEARRAVDYDLVLEPGGIWRVAVVPGRLAEVRPLASPRSRRAVDLRLETNPAALAASLAGAGVREARRAGPLRTKGSRRAAKATFRALAAAPLELVHAARAGLYLPPPVAYLALSRAIPPGWTAGWRFVVAHELTGEGGGAWNLHVDGGAPLRVTAGGLGRPVATVRCSTAAFLPLLVGETAPDGEKVALRGDVAAVGLLRRWVAGVQAGSLPTA